MPPPILSKSPASMAKPPILSKSPASMGKPPILSKSPASRMQPMSVVKPAITEPSPASRSLMPKGSPASGSISQTKPATKAPPSMGLNSAASQLRAVQQAAADPTVRKKIVQIQNPASKLQKIGSKISKKYGSLKRKIRFGFK